MTKKRSSEIFTLKMEVFPEIGLRKFFWVPQIRHQVSAHGPIYVILLQIVCTIIHREPVRQ